MQITYSKEQARHNLIFAVQLVTQAMKRRDPREPGLDEKEKAEERLAALWRRIFRKQRERVLSRLEAEFPDRKSIPLIHHFNDFVPWSELKADLSFADLDLDGEDNESLIKQITDMIRSGISLFGKRSKPDIDYTLTNQQAAEKAREYVYGLVRGINDTTRDALRNAVSSFVQTPGMTIGDLSNAIAPHFGADRADRIAITEVTRAYASGEMAAGNALRQEFPGVRVIKIWFTNADDRVCPICAPLDGQEAEIGADFEGGESEPPAHVGCRCWIETTTALAELE